MREAAGGYGVFRVAKRLRRALRVSELPGVGQQEDSQMGPVLQLVNHVAEAVEKEFPDKIVETLAYQWTRKPPKTCGRGRTS